MTSLFDEATSAHARGWFITPLRGKVPILDRWSTEPAPSLARQQAWARAGNVGLRTGAVSGIDVIDDDTPEQNAAAQLKIPKTVTAITGSGKPHYYLRHHEGVTNSASKLAPKIDVRGDGGQVVFVGSIHPETLKPYVWAPGLSPDDVPVADWPAELVARLLPPKPAPRALTNGTAWARKAVENETASVRAATEGTRNDTLNKAAFSLGQIIAGGGLAEVEVEGALLIAAVGAGLPESESKATIRSGFKAGAMQPRSAPERATRPRSSASAAPRSSASVATQNVLIPGAHVLAGGEYREVSPLQFAVDVLDHLPPGSLYRRASVPGELVGEPLAFRPLVDNRARLLISAYARLIRVKLDEDEDQIEQFVPASRDHGGIIIAGAADHASVRTLEHLVTYPVFTPEWRLTPAGHCHRTYYDEPLALKDLKPVRSSEQIAAVLNDLVIDFPFASEADKHSYFGLLLTPLIRPAISGNCPLHLIASPQERTGKTKLASDVLGGIYLGHSVPALQLTGSEDEREKRIFSLMFAGTRLVLIDNLADSVAVDSPALASALTSSIYQGRILGQSSLVDAPNGAVIVATGNNPKTTGEIAKRTVPIRLESDVDQPELRTNFRHPDISQHAIEQRRLVLECLVGAVLNWLDARQPRGTVPMGGFDRWAYVVGGVLQNAGFSEWLGNATTWRDATDDYSADLHTFVESWMRFPAYSTPAELVVVARDAGVFPKALDRPTERGQQTAIGSILKKALGRVVCGYRIGSTSSGNARHYHLVEPK